MIRLLGVHCAVMLAVLLGIGIVLQRTKWSLMQRYASLLVALAVYGFLLMYIFVPDYGVIDGLPMRWEENASRGALELAVLAAVTLFAVLRPHRIVPHSRRVLAVLLVAQLAYTTLAWFDYRARIPSASPFAIDYAAPPRFSPARSVVLILVDTASLQGFERIRATQSTYANFFRDFTFYRNAVSPFCQTQPTVTAMLTGRVYDNREVIGTFVQDAFLSSASLPRLLRNAGFSVQLYPLAAHLIYADDTVADNVVRKAVVQVDATTMHPLTELFLFRISPHYLKLMRRHVGSDAEIMAALGASFQRSLQQIDRFTAARDSTGTFTYLHLFGAHPPFHYDERLQLARLPFSETSYQRQYEGALRIVNRVLERLREIGAYDNAFIIVAGDHGLSPLGLRASAAAAGREDGFITLLQESNLPLLMVKLPGAHQEHLAVSAAPVSLRDLAKTVLDHYAVPHDAAGADMLRLDEHAPRERETYYFYHVIRDYAPPLWGFRIRGDVTRLESWTPTYRVVEPGGNARAAAPDDYPRYVEWLRARLGELQRDLRW